MAKDKKMSKEYAIVTSLIIFFVMITIVGSIRVVKVIKGNSFDLSNIDIIDQDTNIDWSFVNLNIANAINDKYDIDIYYGDNLNLTNVYALPITDNNRIFEMLKNITYVLESYPEGLTREIEQKGYTVSIYLVDHFTNGIEALANRNTIGQFKIYISDTYNLKRAMHHEYFHILDYYIKLQTDEKLQYINWDSCNPDGFNYTNDVDKITGDYVYMGQSGAHFVTPYAKFSEKEDRAETFAEMFTALGSEIFFNQGEPIRSKMGIISKVLENTFSSFDHEKNLINN